MTAFIYRSPLPDIELVNTDLVSYLCSNPYNSPDGRSVFVDALTGESRTYKNVIQRTKPVAHGLRKLGVKPGDVVAILSPNSIEFPVLCFAILSCDATVCPMESQAKFIIAHSSFLDTARKAVQDTQVKGIIQADGAKVLPGCIIHPSCYGFGTDPAELLSERPAFICFSSGIPGAAKGVIITHQNMTANLQQWEIVYYHGVSPSPAIIAFVPFDPIYGINVFVCGGFLRGQTTVVLSRFDREVYLHSIQCYKPVEPHLVPPIALLLVNDIMVELNDISGIKRILSAAVPMSTELATTFERRFNDRYGTVVHYHQSLGSTETSPLAMGVLPTKMEKQQTVGCIAHNMEFRFVNPETMEDVPQGNPDSELKPAEILCRGPNVTKGYFHNAEATQGAFYTDAQGYQWLRTSDIAVMDKDGYIIIHDRIKGMIKYKGLQVIPSELEGKLQEHPDIVDCGVTALFDEAQATELPVAFVVLKHEAKQDQPELVKKRIHQWLNAKVANHKKLRGGIEFVSTIPKSPSGKILRRELREALKLKKTNAKL
ncbi:hypothetical protein COCSADRAFT_353396 [Bipolaris sorokiniana ND90Pr]|uniref:AMP-dependent synthetase/ligase domain-containing protein n=1 Tax=Cochliobolus sativus (strain ND90Pr / ATCC 201652) TaxID=665912 RepID=M2RHN4_COCSN|nr:uncharacterized protein COCSADRAFT_353396 [Bipolaris sorokiniana ND90Pr]EMD66254.1 hypothetical protein COCSADRAFT_353396 [Bipolaris sorokiniana ND90Pr]